MAKIPVEKEGGGAPWWTWLLGLLLLVLIVGLLWAWIGNGEEAEPVVEDGTEEVEPETAPEDGPEESAISYSDILENPQQYVGQSFPTSEVHVASVPTDRGFWIVSEGDSLFSIIIDVPEEEPKDISPGQTLRITDGTLRDATYLPDIPGDPLTQGTRNIAELQEIFLVVDEQNITILEEGSP